MTLDDINNLAAQRQILSDQQSYMQNGPTVAAAPDRGVLGNLLWGLSSPLRYGLGTLDALGNSTAGREYNSSLLDPAEMQNVIQRPAQTIIGQGLQAGSYFIPGLGEGIGGLIGTGALAGGLGGAGQAMTNNQDVLGGAAGGALTGAALSGGLGLLGKLGNKLNIARTEPITARAPQPEPLAVAPNAGETVVDNLGKVGKNIVQGNPLTEGVNPHIPGPTATEPVSGVATYPRGLNGEHLAGQGVYGPAGEPGTIKSWNPVTNTTEIPTYGSTAQPLARPEKLGIRQNLSDSIDALGNPKQAILESNAKNGSYINPNEGFRPAEGSTVNGEIAPKTVQTGTKTVTTTEMQPTKVKLTQPQAKRVEDTINPETTIKNGTQKIAEPPAPRKISTVDKEVARLNGLGAGTKESASRIGPNLERRTGEMLDFNDVSNNLHGTSNTPIQNAKYIPEVRNIYENNGHVATEGMTETLKGVSLNRNSNEIAAELAPKIDRSNVHQVTNDVQSRINEILQTEKGGVSASGNIPVSKEDLFILKNETTEGHLDYWRAKNKGESPDYNMKLDGQIYKYATDTLADASGWYRKANDLGELEHFWGPGAAKNINAPNVKTGFSSIPRATAEGEGRIVNQIIAKGRGLNGAGNERATQLIGGQTNEGIITPTVKPTIKSNITNLANSQGGQALVRGLNFLSTPGVASKLSAVSQSRTSSAIPNIGVSVGSSTPTSTESVTEVNQNNDQAFLQRLPFYTSLGMNAKEAYTAWKKDNPSSNLTATQQNTLAGLQNSNTQLENLKNVIDQNSQYFGPIQNAIGGLTQPITQDPNRAALNTQLQAIVQQTARNLEGGKLSDKDFQRYAAYLPSLGESADSAKKKIEALQKMISTNLQGIQSQYASNSNLLN